MPRSWKIRVSTPRPEPYMESTANLPFGHRPGTHFFFNHFHDGGRGRSAKPGLEFDPVPVPGIVTGGNDHSAGSTLALYGQRNRRRRGGVGRDLYRNARPGNDLSCGSGRVLRQKTRVVTNDDPAGRIFMTEHIGCNPARHAANILKRKIVRDNAAPAVSAKFDHMQSSVVSRRSSVVSKSASLILSES